MGKKEPELQKVKAIYFVKEASRTDKSEAITATGKSYATGLIIELENGDRYAQLSTDPIVPFEKIDPKLGGSDG